ncbi:MAG: hypothetical protein ACFCUE_14865 [Candidatus Bathyarchaeia archaeon]
MKLATLNKVKRNKPLMILLLPLVACIFLVGWVMCVAGQTSTAAPQKAGQTKQSKDHVTIGAIPFEESQEILAH